MLRWPLTVFLIGWLGIAVFGDITSKNGYEILKVNHEFVDQEGHTESQIGDLVDKARYQRQLERSGAYSGLRFLIHWKAPSTPTPNLTIKLEAHGVHSQTGAHTVVVRTKTYEKKMHITGWAILDIAGEDLKSFGRLKAWKVTFLQNNVLVAELISFMWNDVPAEPQKPTATD